MNKSLAVKLLFYLGIVISIMAGVVVFIFLTTSERAITPMFSNPIVAGIISIIIVILAFLTFIFNSQFLIWKDFVEGNSLGIKIQLSVIIIFLLVIPFLYKTIVEKYALFGFISIIILMISVVLLDLLRLREIKQTT